MIGLIDFFLNIRDKNIFAKMLKDIIDSKFIRNYI